jgi:hypothetical protein
VQVERMQGELCISLPKQLTTSVREYTLHARPVLLARNHEASGSTPPGELFIGASGRPYVNGSTFVMAWKTVQEEHGADWPAIPFATVRTGYATHEYGMLVEEVAAAAPSRLRAQAAGMGNSVPTWPHYVKNQRSMLADAAVDGLAAWRDTERKRKRLEAGAAAGDQVGGWVGGRVVHGPAAVASDKVPACLCCPPLLFTWYTMPTCLPPCTPQCLRC